MKFYKRKYSFDFFWHSSFWTFGFQDSPPPPPPDPPPDPQRNLKQGKSCRAIFGTHTFGSHPPPFPLLSVPWVRGWYGVDRVVTGMY